MPILVREDNLGLVKIVDKGMSRCSMVLDHCKGAGRPGQRYRNEDQTVKGGKVL